MGAADLVAGAQRCCYGTAAAHCGRPATLHVLLDTDGNPTMSCAEHADWWDTHPHYDQHSIMGTCGLPGTFWRYALLDSEGFTSSRCEIEGLDDSALVGSAEATN